MKRARKLKGQQLKRLITIEIIINNVSIGSMSRSRKLKFYLCIVPMLD